MASTVSMKQVFSTTGDKGHPSQRVSTNNKNIIKNDATITYPGQRCDCCPYNYHIDLDFLKYLEAQSSTADIYKSLRKIRQSPSRVTDASHSHSSPTSPTGTQKPSAKQQFRSHTLSSAESKSAKESSVVSKSVTTSEILNEINSSMNYSLFSTDAEPPRRQRPVHLEVVLSPETSEISTKSTTLTESSESDQRYRAETELFINDDKEKESKKFQEKEFTVALPKDPPDEEWKRMEKLVSRIAEKQLDASSPTGRQNDSIRQTKHSTKQTMEERMTYSETARQISNVMKAEKVQRDGHDNVDRDRLPVTSTRLAEQSQLLDERFTESGTVSPNVLQAIRQQMAISLQRMRELEEQVKSISVLQTEIAMLREENRRLLLLADGRSPAPHGGGQPIRQSPERARIPLGEASTQTDVSRKEEMPFTDAELRELYRWRSERNSELKLTEKESRSIGVGDGNVFGYYPPSLSPITATRITGIHSAAPMESKTVSELSQEQVTSRTETTEISYESTSEHRQHFVTGADGQLFEYRHIAIQCDLLNDSGRSGGSTVVIETEEDVIIEGVARNIVENTIRSARRQVNHENGYPLSDEDIEATGVLSDLAKNKSHELTQAQKHSMVASVNTRISKSTSPDTLLKDAWTITNITLGSQAYDRDSLTNVLLQEDADDTVTLSSHVIPESSADLQKQISASENKSISEVSGEKETDQVENKLLTTSDETVKLDMSEKLSLENNLTETLESTTLTSTVAIESSEINVEKTTSVTTESKVDEAEEFVSEVEIDPDPQLLVSLNEDDQVKNSKAVGESHAKMYSTSPHDYSEQPEATTGTVVEENFISSPVESQVLAVSSAELHSASNDTIFSTSTSEQGLSISSLSGTELIAGSLSGSTDVAVTSPTDERHFKIERDAISSLEDCKTVTEFQKIEENDRSYQIEVVLDSNQSLQKDAESSKEDAELSQQVVGSSQQHVESSQQDAESSQIHVESAQLDVESAQLDTESISTSETVDESNESEVTVVEKAELSSSIDALVEEAYPQSRSATAEGSQSDFDALISSNEEVNQRMEIKESVVNEIMQTSYSTSADSTDTVEITLGQLDSSTTTTTTTSTTVTTEVEEEDGSRRVIITESTTQRQLKKSTEDLNEPVSGELVTVDVSRQDEQNTMQEPTELNHQIGSEVELPEPSSARDLTELSSSLLHEADITSETDLIIQDGGSVENELYISDTAASGAEAADSKTSASGGYTSATGGNTELADGDEAAGGYEAAGGFDDSLAGSSEINASGYDLDDGSYDALVAERIYDISDELLAACSVYSQWLSDPDTVPAADMKLAVELIQRQWFYVAGRKMSNSHEVRYYLATFAQFSDGLLSAVINLPDNDGNTTLHYAVSHGNFDVVAVLLETGMCEVNRENRAGYSALLLVALLTIETERQKQLVHSLFTLGDVNATSSSSGQTALMLAASHGRLETVQLLLDCGADVNAQDEDGSTALMCASEHGHSEIIKVLLALPECDSTITDVDGSTALSIAVEEGHQDIGVLLYAHMKNLQAQMEAGNNEEEEEPDNDEVDAKEGKGVS